MEKRNLIIISVKALRIVTRTFDRERRELVIVPMFIINLLSLHQVDDE